MPPRRAAPDAALALACGALVLGALVFAVRQVALFAETDAQSSQLAQVGLLAAGLLALVAVPFGAVMVWSWRGRRRPVWTLMLMLPWVALGGVWIAAARFPPWIGALPAGLAALACLRALTRRTRDPIREDNLNSH